MLNYRVKHLLVFSAAVKSGEYIGKGLSKSQAVASAKSSKVKILGLLLVTKQKESLHQPTRVDNQFKKLISITGNLKKGIITAGVHIKELQRHISKFKAKEFPKEDLLELVNNNQLEYSKIFACLCLEDPFVLLKLYSHIEREIH